MGEIEGHIRRFSFIFIWICTNNVTEYEALYLELSKAISISIRYLVMHDDFELVIKKVRNYISVKHHYLMTYKNRV